MKLRDTPMQVSHFEALLEGQRRVKDLVADLTGLNVIQGSGKHCYKKKKKHERSDCVNGKTCRPLIWHKDFTFYTDM